MEEPISPNKLRILLVICRPAGIADVPYRAVASDIVAGLMEAEPSAFEITVLRPATFIALQKVLRNAAERGSPFNIVHFDGHGAVLKTPVHNDQRLSPWNPDRFEMCGMLEFESEQDGPSDFRLIDGKTIGDLLHKYEAPFPRFIGPLFSCSSFLVVDGFKVHR
jgi:hypothetical protein